MVNFRFVYTFIRSPFSQCLRYPLRLKLHFLNSALGFHDDAKQIFIHTKRKYTRVYPSVRWSVKIGRA